MDYEKKYKEALERAKVIYQGSYKPDTAATIAETLQNVFPELQESEDEKVRKEIVSIFHSLAEGKIPSPINYADIFTWLEKQGEKPKPSIRERYKRIANSEWFKKTHEGMSVSDDEKVDNVNKIEPKFKVGDFIVSDYCMGKVIALTDDAYLLDTEQGIPFSCEHNAHLWTIQDAKDGDVLVTVGDKRPFIHKGCLDPNHPDSPVAYCGIDSEGYFCKGGDKFDHWWTDEKVHPATKEQRDLLFQKMKEAAYEWDAEKKELKKIHIIDEGKAEMDYCFSKMMNGEKVGPAWSEEDELKRSTLIHAVKKQKGSAIFEGLLPEELINWLKYIKQRIGG